MFSPKNWWNIWPTGLFRNATPPEWPGQCHEYEPSRVVDQRLEERRRQRIEVDLGFADDVARHELRRVLEHVDEAVQLAQDVVRDMARGARLAVQEDRDVRVAARTSLTNAQLLDGGRFGLLVGAHELVVVDRQDEGRGPAGCWANDVRSP
jgi:hypothetical protein